MKTNLESRIETMGLENNVFGLRFPRRPLPKSKKAAVALRAKRRYSWATFWFAWILMIAAGLRFATPQA